MGDVALTVGREDRVWIRGANGAGKTTLFGALLDHARLPARRVLEVPQHLSRAEGTRCLDALRRLPPHERGRVLSLVAALGADPDRLLASRCPSPGEARKLALAFGLGSHVWLLALDEPTNDLDLPAVERLEGALEEYPGALLLVTHDTRLAPRVTTTTWHVREGRVITS